MFIKAAKVHQTGGPDVMNFEDPKEGEIRLEHQAIALNKLPADVFYRGFAAVGEVKAVGPGVTTCKLGDIVAYADLEMGIFLFKERIIPADRAVLIPSTVDPVMAAAILFKGLTAEALVRDTYKFERGANAILVNGADREVESCVCQWERASGTTSVIGTVSTKEKVARAIEDGCHHAIVYKEENFVERVMDITSGKGVDVVYDSMGKDTFKGSLACLKRGGLLMYFGQALGEPDLTLFHQIPHKPQFYTFPGLKDDRENLLAAAEWLFSQVGKGVLKVHVKHKYPFSQAAQAHADLENLKTSGLVVLVPDNDFVTDND